ncbi:cytochrome P450 4C1-like [Vespula squamosa]|uniref:Cytochrome P450 4C1-like n=1 Tax=Vespula squamosa TaxID=30214 RepID=A0ABD2BHM1_VESSQ
MFCIRMSITIEKKPNTNKIYPDKLYYTLWAAKLEFAVISFNGMNKVRTPIVQYFLNKLHMYNTIKGIQKHIQLSQMLLCFLAIPKIVLSNLNVTENSEHYKYIKPFAGNGLFSAPGKIEGSNIFSSLYRLKSHMDAFVKHSTVLMKNWKL